MAQYAFAGLVVDMQPRYPTLSRNAEPYRLDTSTRPDIVIRQPKDYIHRMQELNPSFTPDMAEYMRFGSCFYRQLLLHDGMMLHASAVAHNGRAYLFSAPSGTGKSTHTAAWLRLFDDTFLINDDKPALRWINGQLCACGTPFSGKHDLSRNVCLPVGGICVLERGAHNEISCLSKRKAIPSLYDQTVRRGLSAANIERLLEMLRRVLEEVPVYHLLCTPSDEAAHLTYKVMTA